jgi:CBS domain-containing protein
VPQPKVRDVTTTDLITAPDGSSLGDTAAMLTTHQISAVPIVDRFNVAIGILSWTDIGETIEREERRSPTTRGWFRRRGKSQSRWRSRASTGVMTAPPVNIGPDASLSAAGRVMHHRSINRLLVVDHVDKLVGVVTQRDLLKIHSRLDAVIRDEVRQRVLRRTLMISPDAVRVVVDDGVVTLTGRVDRKSTVPAAVGLTAAVAGVTGVIERLAFDTDDTTPGAAARQSTLDPSATPVGHRDQRLSASIGAVGPGFAAYAAQVIRQEAVR